MILICAAVNVLPIEYWQNFNVYGWCDAYFVYTQESKTVVNIPATTVSARCSRTKTCSISPTSVHACRLRTLFRRMAMNTLQISACNIWRKKREKEGLAFRWDIIVLKFNDNLTNTATSTQPIIKMYISKTKCRERYIYMHIRICTGVSATSCPIKHKNTHKFW